MDITHGKLSATAHQSENLICQLLESADIQINGKNPWDIRVHNPLLYDRILRTANLGLGEAYMDGWWDCDAIDQFLYKVLNARLDEKIKGDWSFLLQWARSTLFNLQSPSRAYIVGQAHYDLGNDLYRAMLDQRLNYSCGYWKNAANLDEAQEAKLDLVCKKIGLKPGMHVLDIGFGWGSFAKYAAEKYGARVTGVTVSKE